MFTYLILQAKKINKQQRFYSLPKPYKQIRRFEQSPSSEISAGGRGKHACFYASKYLKTTRNKI